VGVNAPKERVFVGDTGFLRPVASRAFAACLTPIHAERQNPGAPAFSNAVSVLWDAHQVVNRREAASQVEAKPIPSNGFPTDCAYKTASVFLRTATLTNPTAGTTSGGPTLSSAPPAAGTAKERARC
jgi:hypothetical protein